MSFTKVTAAGIGTTGTITYTNVSVAGVITATSATFTGNVSVGGTLTYEDVTNVDSVGLITARSGVSITGGGLVVTGVTTVSAGSTSAPSISPTGDTNTGIFFPSADTIAFGEGGTEVARIDSSGRFGIGTVSPNSQLNVSATDNATIELTATSGGPYRHYLRTQGNDLQVRASSGVIQFFNGNNDGLSSTERARIDTSGRLLVGTSSNNSSFGSGIQIAGTAAEATQLISRYVNSSGGPQLYFSKSRSGTVGTNTIVQADDQLGFIGFYGANGTSYDSGASIAAFVDATPGSSSDMPGRLVFSTTADGASSPTERMRLDSSGRLGIGSSTPGDSSAGAGLFVNAYVNRTAYYVPSGSYAASLGGVDNTNTKVWLSIDSGYNQASAESAGIFLSAKHVDTGGSDCGYTIKNLASNNSLVFSRVGTAATTGNATETARMTLTSAGSLGIGSTAPNYELQINASDTLSAIQLTNTSTGATASDGFIVYNNGVNATISNEESGYLRFQTAGTERAQIDSSGRLLVGTSTSRSVAGLGECRLQLSGDYLSSISVTNNENNTNSNGIALSKIRGSSIVQSGDSFGGVYYTGYDGATDRIGASILGYVDGTPGAGDMPGRLVFSTTADGASSPTERVRITQQGFFKATNSNDYYGSTATYHESRTNAVGNVTHLFSHAGTSGNSYGIQISYAQNRGTQAGDQYIYCNDIAALRMEVRGNGGIANYQANNVNLSDRNVKKDITPASGTWNCIKEWEIVNYRYKDQPDDADLNLGVIAQQVAESCPEVITVFQEAKEAKPAVLDDDGNEVEAAQESQPEKLGVKEQQMYWMAIKALQEAQVRIEQLEARLTAAGID